MEDLNLIKTTENVIDKSVRMSEIKQSKVEQEIAIEKRKLGERAIFATMEIETGDLNNFNEKLNQVTKSLPKYQLIERQLANIKKTRFALRAF